MMTFISGVINCTNCGRTKKYQLEGWPYRNGWTRRADNGHHCPKCSLEAVAS